MPRRPIKFGLMAAVAFSLSACVSPRNIPTPTGNVSGFVPGPFVVLGVADQAVSTQSVPDGRTTYLETVDLQVPLGTQVIVPVLKGFDMGFGSTDPADLSPQPVPESTFLWRSADHYFGMQGINVGVVDIDAPAPGATSQSARIQIGLRLTDHNSDDPWWGVVRYQLIFLGNVP